MNFNLAKFEISFGKFTQIPPSVKVEIAFSGRSNVGKSSLINKIFNRKGMARVSSMPGKTATINFFSVENIYLVDLPGYGYAKVAKTEKERWSELIEGYLNDERHLSLVFQLVDMRHPPSANDLNMINFLIESEIPFAIVFTKADKLSKRQREERKKGFAEEIPYFEEIKTIDFSAMTGEGVDEIRKIIEELAVDVEPMVRSQDEQLDLAEIVE